METKFINFFKYLEDKEGKKIPLSVKLLNPEQFKITSEDLEVGGNLDLDNTSITSLPKDLKVGGDLTLFNSKIQNLIFPNK